MTLNSKIKKTATVASGLAAATFVPQLCDAEIVTVGGDGGVGSVVLSGTADSTNFGGVLANDLDFTQVMSYNYFHIGGGARLGDNIVRSSVSTIGNLSFGYRGGRFLFSSYSAGRKGAQRGSDNWLAGEWRVNGVNNEEFIYGWIHVNFDTSLAFTFDSPEIISFTYDDAATDATAFAKPVGGFSVSAVPEPSSLVGLGLLALGAAGVRRRRQFEPSKN